MKKNVIGFVAAMVAVCAGIALYFIVKTEPPEQKNFLVGVVNPNLGTKEMNRGFIEGLKEKGYIEGENVTIIQYTGRFDIDGAITDLLTKNVDLIFCATTPATKKIKEATLGKNIPVVFAMYDPVKSDVIESLAHPGGHLTGIQIRGSCPKALEWLVALSPDIKNIYVPVKFDTKAARQSIEAFQKTADHLGVKLRVAEVNTTQELDTALAAIPPDMDAILITHSILISSHTAKVINTAIQKKLPTGAAIGKAQEGALIAYSPRLFETGAQASRLAHLALKGVSVNDIPAERALFFLEVNKKTADATGITVPNDILIQADFIYR